MYFEILTENYLPYIRRNYCKDIKKCENSRQAFVAFLSRYDIIDIPSAVIL